MKYFEIIFIGFITLLMIGIIVLLQRTGNAKDRCQDYVPDVRQAAIQYLGLGYPYWYNIGCAITESNCRGNLKSFDGGYGIYQFTPSTGIIKDMEKSGLHVDPYNTESSIRGQAFYMHLIRDKKLKASKSSVHGHPIYPANYISFCGQNLSDLYRTYNGGFWFVYESTRKSGVSFVCENREMFKYCVRTGTWVGTGKNRRWLSFCEVNYSYPEKVYKYSQPYKVGKDSVRFWYPITNKKLKFWNEPLSN